MSFDIEFDYEIEQLGLMLHIEAKYDHSGGGSDEPAYGPTCTDISAIVCDENDANDLLDIWEGLADLYTTVPVPFMVWVKGSEGWHVEASHSGMRVASQAGLVPPKYNFAKWEADNMGRQKVYRLVSLQSIIQEMADEKAEEAEAEGAGKPDPDEAFDAAREDAMMEGK